ncbi:glucoamylase [Mycobacterium lehmannii]|uniref:Trehalase n=1 Tax=Mycobacterium lehmannii TaxID=2048550 RepID=A0A101A3G9_9MYCO|nr:glycoside hydrolase family 15 protein [Mycobacterium lehmannii]KUI12340.1 glucoamylase [Mycobacterium lehmannii]
MTASAIEDYALLGDLQSVALVGRDGSIDWLCLPRFDSPACFSALVGDPDSGRWSIAPADVDRVTRRAYRGDSLVLQSEWKTRSGAVRVLDFMPPRGESPDVVRIVEGLDGDVVMQMSLQLRFDYGHIVPRVRRKGGDLVAIAGPDSVYLRTPIACHGDHLKTTAQFTVSKGERVPFVLTHRPSHLPPPEIVDAEVALRDTEQFWTQWISRCRYTGRYAEEVRRSLLFLKALTYAPTGGIVAAATTSLPEMIGGSRNWDYRYCWLRDATFTLQALLGAGYHDEASAWREWLVRAVAGDPARLQIMYALDGARRVREEELPWLSGYRDSSPVRIGNSAGRQFQLDVYGEVLDGLHLAREAGLHTDDSAWDVQRALLDYLEGHWQDADSSLWEIRGEPRQFVHSKVMAWAGVDRAVRSVEHHGLDGPAEHWGKLRDQIHDDVCANGFNSERNTFTQSYGSTNVDAALLLIPRVGFLPWSDPRVRGTIDTVRTELSRDGLLLRYRNDDTTDGLPGQEGAFLACSFWLADALHGTGRTAEAVELFERLLDLRNDVGMLSEEFDTGASRQVSNTPQAFSLVGLINTARHLAGSTTITSAGGEEQDVN